MRTKLEKKNQIRGDFALFLIEGCNKKKIQFHKRIKN
jgi:hypothetical protein